ncbi:MAG TPA: PQQ-dependent sugar dehydrogenase [Sedimentibacter sp.]|nr:PQQ-dependent sugar dehydrogenase [Sedimentibacter sp.]HOH69896.1 PQQ-dependent sugar dehydrogenase [Sedimentibacter sp.]
MKKISVSLRPLVSNINLPTVIKTAVLPGDSYESIFIAGQVGEIYNIRNGQIRLFLDIRQRIIRLGQNGGYDERGLLGLAFHPNFYLNGLFYLHYSAAGTQGPGALSGSFQPNPCDPETLNLRWTNRDTQYDHIDTVEEWSLQSNGQAQKRRTLLNLRRPFMNHNGVNSLNFSPETGRLVLTTGDGGSGYDPFNSAQNIMEVAGKIIEIDVNTDTAINNLPVVTRFNELPEAVQRTLTVMAKGVRNIPGIAFQRYYNQYIKYAGNVGQDLIESIFTFTSYKPIPVTEITQAANQSSDQEGFVNLGWRGWEGDLPTPIINSCLSNSSLVEKTTAYYNEAISTAAKRLLPLTCYYHMDSRPDKFRGTALTGVQPYMGYDIPDLTGCIVFIDFARKGESPVRGALAYTKVRTECRQYDYSLIDTNYNFGSQSAYYVSLGTNLTQSKLYLGVYGSSNVTDLNQGTVFEIV